MALIFDQGAFAEDCLRAAVVVTPLYAPTGCAANIVIDRETLRRTGAVTLAMGDNGTLSMRPARGQDEDRPWSPSPKVLWRYDPRTDDRPRDAGEDGLRTND